MEASISKAPAEGSHARTEQSAVSKIDETKKPDPGGTFKCAYCPLEEHYDYKGGKPPFAKQICFSEQCYMMKDPWSPPRKGQVLVLGGDCSICTKAVCLGCSIFYTKRFCSECARDNMKNFPSQLHSKIQSLKSVENG